ncbi:hypothetical protein Csa_001940 [Cucumis sativus]|uniref:Uncharacterized protein n=1 Tax=Cucumis sativus TaxID=3659 RepID=A0A0A0LCU2_CUCSA|nr:hypothetical protein Csa_001940 [Cucumis sativus]
MKALRVRRKIKRRKRKNSVGRTHLKRSPSTGRADRKRFRNCIRIQLPACVVRVFGAVVTSVAEAVGGVSVIVLGGNYMKGNNVFLPHKTPVCP